ncbi:2-keto-4-pentenoate hydratase [compost metagenome]
MIEAVIPSIEIADARFSEPASCSPAAALCDLAFSGAWVKGVEVKDWRAIELRTLKVSLCANGQMVREGVGSIAMGDPLEALRAMFVDMGRRGEILREGAVVTAGTYTVPYLVKPGDRLLADFGCLGVVEADFD